MNSQFSSSIPPIVLVASGLDPTGSAGIIADIRTITLIGCHPCGAITCQTVQSSRGLVSHQSTDPSLLREQLATLVEDFRPSAVKIGALVSSESIQVIADVLKKISPLPVILDPVFSPSVGPSFLDSDGIRAMSAVLLPHVTLATPNIDELGAPAGFNVEPFDDKLILECASWWLRSGVKNVLVTGLERGAGMVDRLFQVEPDNNIIAIDFTHPRHHVGKVHGTGCILSSAVAAFMAKGESLQDSIHKASEHVSGVILNSRQIGKGMRFWVPSNNK